jgi:hypothetical protein
LLHRQVDLGGHPLDAELERLQIGPIHQCPLDRLLERGHLREVGAERPPQLQRRCRGRG